MIPVTGSLSWQGAIIPCVVATNILLTSLVSHEAPHVLTWPGAGLFSQRPLSLARNLRVTFKPRPLSTGRSLSLSSVCICDCLHIYISDILLFPRDNGGSGDGWRWAGEECDTMLTLSHWDHTRSPGQVPPILWDTFCTCLASWVASASYSDNPSPALICRQEEVVVFKSKWLPYYCVRFNHSFFWIQGRIQE